MFYCFIWNHTVDSEIADSNYSPYTLVTGRSDDISLLLCFRFNEPVYCLIDPEHQSFPLESKEICARWVGISDYVDAPMTWKILTDKTQKILHCSEICSALDPTMRNLSIDPLSSTDFQIVPARTHPDDSPP